MYSAWLMSLVKTSTLAQCHMQAFLPYSVAEPFIHSPQREVQKTSSDEYVLSSARLLTHVS